MSALAKTLTVIAGFVLAIYGILFFLQNAQPAQVALLILPTLEMPVAVWLMLAMVLGFVVGVVVSGGVMVRLRAENLSLRRKLKS